MEETVLDGEGRVAQDARRCEDRDRDNGVTRTFPSGATRESKANKISPKGSLSPLALTRFCEYMREKRNMPDGSRRSCDDWKKGVPPEEYADSLFRHVLELHRICDGWDLEEKLEETLCAVLFNAQGWLHEILKTVSTGRDPSHS